MPTIDFYVPSIAVLDVSRDVPHGFDGFRDDCLSGGEVICDWESLESYLVDGRIASYWWYLTAEERFLITEKTVSNTFLYYIEQYGFGDSGCAGNVQFWDTATCGHNASIRALKFSPHIPPGPWADQPDVCYYRRYPAAEEHCFLPDELYSLPCHCVLWNNETDTHYMCAIQVDVDKSLLDSWYIFQYGDADIKHGHWQMSGSGTLEIGVIKWIGCNGMSFSDEVRFEL